MILALLICNICMVFTLRGNIPPWFELVLCVLYMISAVTALIIWEYTNDKIKYLTNKIKKKGE